MYYVYVLLSEKDGRSYTGITNNINKRLRQHNHGYKATRSTLNRGPFKLLYAQICHDRIEARSFEKYLKSGEGRELRNELLKL